MSEVAIYAAELDAALIARNAPFTSDDMKDADLIELYMTGADPEFVADELIYGGL